MNDRKDANKNGYHTDKMRKEGKITTDKMQEESRITTDKMQKESRITTDKMRKEGRITTEDMEKESITKDMVTEEMVEKIVKEKIANENMTNENMANGNIGNETVISEAAVNENVINGDDMTDRIRQMSEHVEIPDSLLPSNMMRRIEDMKEKDKRLVRRKTKEKKRICKGIFAGVAVAFSLCIILAGKSIYNQNMKNDDDSYVKKVLYNTDETEPVENTGEIAHISDREKVLSLVTSKSIEDYFDRRKSRNVKEDVVFDGALTEADDEMQVFEESYNGGVYENETGAAFSNADSSEAITEYGGTNSEDSSYYQNNDQVEGVKEPDYVITDGKNIYTLSNNEVIITAANGQKVENASKTNYFNEINSEFKQAFGINADNEDEFDAYSYNNKMFVNGNKMVILFNYETYYDYDVLNEDVVYDGIYTCYGNYGSSYAVIMQYDISDIHEPKLDDMHKIEGYIISSRMVGDYLYVITNRATDTCISLNESFSKEINRIRNNSIPKIDDREISCDDIYLMNNDIESFNYQVTVAFKIEDDRLAQTDSMAVLSGYSDVYVNNEHIYTFSVNYVKGETVDELGNKLETYKNQTKIYKFAYNEGNLEPYASGVVDGELLNQFSLDEYNGYLRLVSSVADERNPVTAGSYIIYEDVARTTNRTNALYILDDMLNICGSIEGLAENERIYSARFSGDRAYFVTYVQMDPLFVADLSDVNHPVITDELEMTGYSDYLQKWDEDTLLGVGIEATERGVSKGLKLALYDVSDDGNISEISKLVLEDWYSYYNYDYKNMMIAPEKSIVGMSVEDNNYNTHYLLFKIENGEIEIAFDYIVEDYDDRYALEDYYDYYGYDHLHRGLYIGDYLYIVTVDRGIAAVSLKDYSVAEYVKFN